METEIWVQIKNYPNYKISNTGKIESHNFKKPRLLKQKISKKGYHSVGLCNENGRQWFLVHRLVMEHFSPIEEMEEYEVNHKDENKSNNNLSNLEWVTSKENCNYGTRNIRNSIKRQQPVRCIETGEVFMSLQEAANKTGANYHNLSGCINGKRYKTGGYHWEKYNIGELFYDSEIF